MKYEKNRKIFGIDEYILIKRVKIILPLVLIFVIFLVILTNILKKPNQKVNTTNKEVITNEIEETKDTKVEQDSVDDVSEETKTKITELIQAFYLARLKGNIEELYSFYNEKAPEDYLEVQRKLTKEKILYDGYEDFVCNIKRFGNEDKYLVFVSAKLRPHKGDMTLPLLNYTYVYKDGDNYYLQDNTKLNKEELDFVKQIEMTDEVQKMNDDMISLLTENAVSDVSLGTLYTVLSGEALLTGVNKTQDIIEPLEFDLDIKIDGKNVNDNKVLSKEDSIHKNLIDLDNMKQSDEPSELEKKSLKVFDDDTKDNSESETTQGSSE